MELDDRLAFIVTEPIEGRNLKEDGGTTAVISATIWNVWPVSSIDATKASSKGAVHRDIKLTNVMVSASHLRCWSTFGIAMGEGEKPRDPHHWYGHTRFIAPKIIEGAESDEMTDWWSVASCSPSPRPAHRYSAPSR